MQVKLTHQQAQYLITRLSLVAAEEQSYRMQLKRVANLYWDMCDKNNPESSEHFKTLNAARNLVRESKQEEAKINAVIRSLRKVS